MKTCLLLALVWLAISFAFPTFAQEQSAVDPETRHEIEAVLMQFVDAYNKHDATAIAALFTQDAVRVGDWSGGGLFVGREAIEKDFEKEFAASFPPIVRKSI
jgi:ketosteroid isomerase-like protein